MYIIIKRIFKNKRKKEDRQNFTKLYGTYPYRRIRNTGYMQNKMNRQKWNSSGMKNVTEGKTK
jgi:hypothetical protein